MRLSKSGVTLALLTSVYLGRRLAFVYLTTFNELRNSDNVTCSEGTCVCVFVCVCVCVYIYIRGLII